MKQDQIRLKCDFESVNLDHIMNPYLDCELALQRVEKVLDERLPLRDHGILQILRRVLGKVLEREAGEGIESCSVARLFVPTIPIPLARVFFSSLL